MSVAKGSSEEPWLLELHYNRPDPQKEGASDTQPTVLVGKGMKLPCSRGHFGGG